MKISTVFNKLIERAYPLHASLYSSLSNHYETERNGVLRIDHEVIAAEERRNVRSLESLLESGGFNVKRHEAEEYGFRGSVKTGCTVYLPVTEEALSALQDLEQFKRPTKPSPTLMVFPPAA